MKTKDKEDLDELVDIYSSTQQFLGIAKKLEEVHRDGDWHRTFHCWIVNPNYENGSMLLQWRGNWKRNWPGRVDAAAAGHYEHGESLEGGLRELKEELGIEINHEDLIDVGVRLTVEDFENGVKNREFQDVRFLLDNRNISEYTVNYPEVGGLVYLTIDAGLRLLSNETKSEDCHGFIYEQASDNSITKRDGVFTLTNDNFIPSIDRYAYKSFIIASRIIRGDKHLQI